MKENFQQLRRISNIMKYLIAFRKEYLKWSHIKELWLERWRIKLLTVTIGVSLMTIDSPLYNPGVFFLKML